MNATKLDTIIQLQERSTVQNKYGEEIEVFKTRATVWAQRQSRPGREFMEAGRTISETRVYFVIRYRGDLKTVDRVVCGDETYNILNIRYSDTIRNSWVLLECSEVE